MTESLYERVEAALGAELDLYLDASREISPASLTRVVFEAMAGARPCVTCGKGIGPAKVDKGYVQCYDCTRRRPIVA